MKQDARGACPFRRHNVLMYKYFAHTSRRRVIPFNSTDALVHLSHKFCFIQSELNEDGDVPDASSQIIAQ